jgi:hypothetical protein
MSPKNTKPSVISLRLPSLFACFVLLAAVGSVQAQTNAVTMSFTNPAFIDIPPFQPVGPVKIQVPISGTIQKVTVSIFGLTHSSPSDIQGIMVTGPDTNSPTGDTDTNSVGVELMSSAGGGNSVSNVNLTFDDAATNMLPANGQIVSGTNLESVYIFGDYYPAPAPANYSTTTNGLTNFIGAQMFGTWGLYIEDFGTIEGAISNGWAITITYIPSTNTVLPPTVSITSPTAGQTFTAPATIPITATATNPAGTIQSVQFFVNTNSIATNTIAPYTATASNLAAGTYTLTAIAKAANGLTATNAVQVTVNSVTTNGSLTLTSPTNTPGGQIQFSVKGTAGTAFTIQASSDLQTWVTVTNATIPAGGSFVFTGTSGSSHLFYRASTGGSGGGTNGPTLTTPAISNGHFQFSLSGGATNYWIQSSTNLQTWTTISTNAPTNGTLNFTDPGSVAGNRYYRVIVGH